MTVLPRITTSPVVTPSAGTPSPVSVSITDTSSVIGIRTPWRAFSAARSPSGSASQASSQAQWTTWPVVSVRP